ncbi:hypothetical protein ONS95_006626 [Cadophora gregata]|uniref:uncharacterized protein n=1 Tax=Cadophora gregata TaxID=51156 RepID=UPI0026DB205A|nr:uncharacterized protein ONS95_006626 [Cadophora gregata]KAK0101454.1 hypothetical protein ONS95_006626 [Cadophora gregata]
MVRPLAESYGFMKVITTADMVKTFAGDVFAHLGQDGRTRVKKFGKEIEHLLPDGTVEIAAILVFVSPSSKTCDLDAQIVNSILLTEKGVYPVIFSKNGNTSLPNKGYLQDDQPKIYFSNMHESWSTAAVPAYTSQVKFRNVLKAVWDISTDNADLKPRHHKIR